MSDLVRTIRSATATCRTRFLMLRQCRFAVQRVDGGDHAPTAATPRPGPDGQGWIARPAPGLPAPSSRQLMRFRGRDTARLQCGRSDLPACRRVRRATVQHRHPSESSITPSLACSTSRWSIPTSPNSLTMNGRGIHARRLQEPVEQRGFTGAEKPVRTGRRRRVRMSARISAPFDTRARFVVAIRAGKRDRRDGLAGHRKARPPVSATVLASARASLASSNGSDRRTPLRSGRRNSGSRTLAKRAHDGAPCVPPRLISTALSLARQLRDMR